MDFASLSDAEIERLSGSGRTPEERLTARRLLRRRRTRERRRQGWSRQTARTADRRQAPDWTRGARPTQTTPSRFDRRALEALCVKEGWADMPPESRGDLALFLWCVARGLYDRPGIRQLL